MIKKLKIPYPIVVEGKYDRLRLLTVCEGQILVTDGFGIFKKQEKLSLLRRLAEKSPILVLTDSDGAGKVIRSHLAGAIPPDRIIHLYIPKIRGVESRKSLPSAEGTLGVEGMEEELLYSLLSPYEDENVIRLSAENPLSKTDLYCDGLCGASDSAKRRDELCLSVGLPTGMTPNALLAALRILYSYDEYLSLVGRKNEKSRES